MKVPKYLIKKAMKMAKDLKFANHVRDWMLKECGMLCKENITFITEFWEKLPMPKRSDYFEWTIVPINRYIPEERLLHIENFFISENWVNDDIMLSTFWRHLRNVIMEYGQ